VTRRKRKRPSARVSDVEKAYGAIKQQGEKHYKVLSTEVGRGCQQQSHKSLNMLLAVTNQVDL